MYKEPPVKCVDSFVLIIFFASLSIFHDLLILAMPLPTLWRLQLHWKKKMHVMIMFSVGLFVILCSALRFPYLFSMRKTMDPSCRLAAVSYFCVLLIVALDDQAPVALWSYLEMAVGIICGCLPSFRSLLGFIFRKPEIDPSHSNKNSSNSASSGFKSNRKSFSTANPKLASNNDNNAFELDKRGTSEEQIIRVESRTSDESSHFRLVQADIKGGDRAYQQIKSKYRLKYIPFQDARERRDSAQAIAKSKLLKLCWFRNKWAIG